MEEMMASRNELDSTAAITIDSTVVATRDQVSSELADEAVILHFANGVYYGLDPVGARIWQLVQKPTQVATVRDQLLSEYDVEREQCERDLLNLLRDLNAAGLVDITDRPQRGQVG